MVSNKKDQVIPLLGPNNIGSTCNGSTPRIYEYMPIDFIKVELIGLDARHLLDNPILDFTRKFNEDTGELKLYEHEGEYKKQNPRKAKYKNLVFIIQDNGKMYLHGSIHKYFNQGLHNYNNFTYLKYQRALKRLKNQFGISPSNMRIQTLEFGLNITPPYDTDKILRSCFQYRKQNIVESISNSEGKYKQVKLDKFTLKLYNKSKQYLDRRYKGKFRINKDIFRIEIKQSNWSQYNKIGVKSLEDFNNYDKSIFINRLIEVWESVIFFNPLNFGKKMKFDYSNPVFWDELTTKVSNTSYFKHTEKLKIMNKNPLDLQKEVSLVMLKNLLSMQPKRKKGCIKSDFIECKQMSTFYNISQPF